MASYYPNFPDAPRAGFIFTLDVGTLLDLGVRQGNHNLVVRVGDVEQTFAELPNRDGIPVWFQCVDRRTTTSLATASSSTRRRLDFVSGDVMFRGWAIADNSDPRGRGSDHGRHDVGVAQHGFPRPDVEDQYPQNSAPRDNSGWQLHDGHPQAGELAATA